MPLKFTRHMTAVQGKNSHHRLILRHTPLFPCEIATASMADLSLPISSHLIFIDVASPRFYTRVH